MYITAVETYLPGKNITNEEVGELINFKPQLISKLFGNYGRHLSTNIKTGEITANTTELISVILEKIFSANKNSIEDTEFIIVSTATPDYLLPTSVNEACYKLGLKNIETYQLMAGCSGAVQALKLAQYMINSKKQKKGIVIGVECSYKFLNIFNKGGVRLSPREMVNYTLFGDGVGGCIVEDSPSAHSVGIKDIIFQFTGINEKIGQLATWKGSRNDIENDIPMVQEEYKLIEKIVPELTSKIYNELLKNNAGLKKGNWFMPPQLSGKMVGAICKDMAIPESKIISLVDKIGNCANAALYFQIKDFLDAADDNDEGIAISIESSRWLSSGLYLSRTPRNGKNIS